MFALATMIAHPDKTIVVASYNQEKPTMTETATVQRPADYTTELAETIRARRLYTGISQRGFAKALDIDRRTYQRIENGQEQCWPGFLDQVHAVLDRFDAEVSAISDAANVETDLTGKTVKISVPTDPREEWERAVASRASVENEDILLVATPS